LVYLGRLHPSKGILQLLDAWRSVASDVKSRWTLKLVGWGTEDFEAVVKRKIAELCIERSVDLAGPHYGPEKSQTLACADGFILPSFSEGLPASVLEAWAYEKPVLMTKECNLNEGIAKGAALELRPEALSIATAIEQFVNMSDSERFAMGVAGRALVVAKYSWPKIAEQFAEVYRWLAHRGDRPECMVEL